MQPMASDQYISPYQQHIQSQGIGGKVARNPNVGKTAAQIYKERQDALQPNISNANQDPTNTLLISNADSANRNISLTQH